MKKLFRIVPLVLILILLISGCGPDYSSMSTSELLSFYNDATTKDKAKVKINAELLTAIPTLSFDELEQISEQNDTLRPNAESEINSRLLKMELDQLSDIYLSGGAILRELISSHLEDSIFELSISQLFFLLGSLGVIDERIENITVEQIRTHIGALSGNSDFIEAFTLLLGVDNIDIKNNLIEDVKASLDSNNDLAGLYREMIDSEELAAAAKVIVKPIIITRLAAITDNATLIDFANSNHYDLAQEAIQIIKSRISGMSDDEIARLSDKTSDSELLSALSAEAEARKERARKAEEEAARQWSSTHSFSSKYSDGEIQDALARYYMEEENMSSTRAASAAKTFVALAKSSSKKDNMSLMIFLLALNGYL
jgi:serine/threonine protein phosphatase PrpC